MASQLADMEIDEERQQGAARQGAAGGAGQGPSLFSGKIREEGAEKKEAGEKLKEPSVNLTSQASKFQLQPARKNPVACIVLGMAGSGKTTLMQRIALHVQNNQIPSYVVNLDPAVTSMPYGCNIDIRDTVNYKEVMKQYQLGPNGGIMTALNLFATKFDQVVDLIEKKADELEYVFVDTPGQIEIFTWSASGSIISDMLAYSFPTVVVYVVDTPRAAAPVTFMSNMLYACSIMYKLKLPFILVFNKTDITPCAFAQDWMTDSEKFAEAVQTEKAYAGSLSQSMSLVLEEFYKAITSVGVSAVTGDGMDDLFAAIGKGADEYSAVYRPNLEALAAKKNEREAKAQRKKLDRLRKQMAASGGLDEKGAKKAAKEEEEEEEEEDEEPIKRRGFGGIGVFQGGDTDDEEDDEYQEDDHEDLAAARAGQPLDMMTHMRMRAHQEVPATDAEDMRALNEILSNVNAGGVRVDK